MDISGKTAVKVVAECAKFRQATRGRPAEARRPRSGWRRAAARARLARGHLAGIDHAGESVRDAGLALPGMERLVKGSFLEADADGSSPRSPT